MVALDVFAGGNAEEVIADSEEGSGKGVAVVYALCHQPDMKNATAVEGKLGRRSPSNFCPVL